MDFALSLKTGLEVTAQAVAASPAAYRAATAQLLTCPECGEPVHLRQREIPYSTPYFAHHKQVDSVKALHACSLRTLGNLLQPASAVVAGLQHGQLVDRFQREFLKELHAALGKHSSHLYGYLQATVGEKLGPSQCRALVAVIERQANFARISQQELSAAQIRELDEALHDVCLFLRSSHGQWVTGIVQQVARFVAAVSHPDIKEGDVGGSLFTVGSRYTLFVAEPYRLTRAAELLAIASARRTRMLPQVMAALVGFLILKWRLPRHAPKLLIAAEHVQGGDEDREAAVKTRPASDRAAAVVPAASGHTEAPVAGAYHQPVPDNWWHFVHSKMRQAASAPPASASDRNFVVRPDLGGDRPVPPPPPPSPGALNAPSSIRAVRLFASPPPSASNIDASRISQLLRESGHLARPSSPLRTKADVLAWSGRQNPFEAYFLAACLDVAHSPPEFSDPTLQRKLADWVICAKAWFLAPGCPPV